MLHLLSCQRYNSLNSFLADEKKENAQVFEEIYSSGKSPYPPAVFERGRAGKADSRAVPEIVWADSRTKR